MTTQTIQVAEYRYFLADFLTNVVIAEIPFRDVSYERSISSAGSFSGKIPVIDSTDVYALYENTMPGKTALYVVRNDECMWGGIIWSRSYSLRDRSLSVNGTEFPSYFHRRNIWKTYSNDFTASVVVSGGAGIGAVTISSGQFNFAAGMPVRVSFYEIGNFKYSGVKTVLASPDPTATTFSVEIEDSTGAPIPNGTYTSVTVIVRVDTYDYIRSLLRHVFNDFINVDFPNGEITPSKEFTVNVTTKALTNGLATLTCPGHGISAGQTITVTNVGSPFDGIHEVSSVTTGTIAYLLDFADVPQTSVSSIVRNVTKKGASDPLNSIYPIPTFTAAIQTSVAHGFSVGDYVTVSGVDDAGKPDVIFDGLRKITRVYTSPNPIVEFRTENGKRIRSLTNSSGGTVTKAPYIIYGTYGSFPGNADPNIEFSTEEYSGEVHLTNKIIRGFEMVSVGRELDEYADALNGFEYRIDCEFNPQTNSFTRTFVFIPIDFPDPSPPLAPGEAAPLSRYGAQNYIFEYPGNINELELRENAEDSATRFFVVGNDGNLGSDASQPYSVATANDLLGAGWPLLDSETSKNDVFDEDELYDHAERYLSEFRPPVGDFTISVNGSLPPTVNTYKPGDWCALIINDPFVLLRLASDLEPRDDILVRKIEGFSVSVPNNPAFPENVSLRLIQEAEIDKVGQ
jgi:hypothetical protein